MSINLDKITDKIKLEDTDLSSDFGYVNRVIGLVIEAKGPAKVSIGEICNIISENKNIKAEVVGFDNIKFY
jgi:flagellum-specific ATP synthase